MADIFREVDEDLRRDNFTQLWKKYGGVIVGIAVLIVVVTALVIGWREWRISRSLEYTERLAVASDMAASGDVDSAIAEYDALAEDADGGHRLLARLHEAALAAEAGNRERAVASYDAVVGSDADQVYRDLASLLWVMHSVESGEPEALIERLVPLTADDNAWRYSARELTALLEQRRGNRDKAVELLSALQDAPAAPADLRARAGEMLAALGAGHAQ